MELKWWTRSNFFGQLIIPHRIIHFKSLSGVGQMFTMDYLQFCIIGCMFTLVSTTVPVGTHCLSSFYPHFLFRLGFLDPMTHY